MSASIVNFRDLRLKDEIYIVSGDPTKTLTGRVTGIGPGRNLILDGDRQIAGIAPSVSFIVVNED